MITAATFHAEVVDAFGDGGSCALAALGVVRAVERAAIRIRWLDVTDTHRVRIDHRPRARVARQRHRKVRRAVVRAVARNDDATWLAQSLPHDLDGMFVRIGAADREEHASACEARTSSSRRSASSARGRAPQALVTKQSCSGLRADRGDDARMLVAEVAALGEAAHVENRAAVLEVQVSAGAADHGRGIPLRLRTPAVQDRTALGDHDFTAKLDQCECALCTRMFALRTILRMSASNGQPSHFSSQLLSIRECDRDCCLPAQPAGIDVRSLSVSAEHRLICCSNAAGATGSPEQCLHQR